MEKEDVAECPPIVAEPVVADICWASFIIKKNSLTKYKKKILPSAVTLVLRVIFLEPKKEIT